MTFNYQSWLKSAEDRLELLYRQKANIEEEIENLERGIDGFAPLANRPRRWSGPETGITESIRMAFRNDPHRVFSATEVRDTLLNQGTALSQRNPMATIHQILVRLVQKGTIKPVIIDSKTRYQWAGEEQPKVKRKKK